ncbi:M13 family metallopeptidase [Mucilaginibacter sp. KACC 22773]|uniref:M13 family metallopeptidase n=1 Tax=Mucilaginibacter sp. KACC 22773 TaxID=3025671 RepID=UPI0023658E34|nr:M13 family metallopeptidase [Mucilaginibacter sp. KACC 22773]WDF76325.1 M13 family metallopeptidase [Mucilaginibacter sp. KACC 22773]
MKLRFWCFIFLIVLWQSVNAQVTGKVNPPKHKRSPPAPVKFIDPANMDTSVKAGDDFFEYANGAWIKNNPIPAKENRWGSFAIVRQENAKKLIELLKEVSRQSVTAPKGSLIQRVGDLYASSMDTVTIEKLGYSPIKPDLERIDKVDNLDDLINELAFERVNGIFAQLFGLEVNQDDKNASKYIVRLGQGGTALPDRDYYLKNDQRSKDVRDALKTLAITVFTLSGCDAGEAVKNATIVYNLETALAKAQLSRVAMRDPHVIYNKFLVADFNKVTPHLNWTKLLPMLKASGQDSILVGQPTFFKVADSLLAAVPVENWKVFFKWNILKGASLSLSSPFVRAYFAYNSALTGEKRHVPRNEQSSHTVDGALGELLGQLYVEKYFSPAARQYMLELVNNMKMALSDRIKRLDWMSTETKEHALKKLNAFTVKIGYPDKWETYAGVIINRNDYLGNMRSIYKWRYNFMVGHLGKPVDKARWGLTPSAVNAYYTETNNEIVFPAGILQFPFFDLNADDAINYGGIGALIGHEMTHGFDDKGRQYDADGNLRDWWTKSDADKFKVRANQLVMQYNNLTVLDSLHINGKLTLGENIADLGGLSIAYEAFLKTKQGQSGNTIDGFTPNQRFFLSWAQIWRSSQRPEAAAQRILTDPHSPDPHRANATLTNISAWYKAFNVKPGNKMYKKPADRTEIW